MIVLNVRQGSQEWQDARLGIPTASNFDRILTPKTRKPSSAQGKYLCELVAERLLGYPVEALSSSLMERGTELEDKAAEEYELETGSETERVGFILHDSQRWGCSPDRLVGRVGMLETKCLNAANHVAALLGMKDDDHYAQCQGQLWVAEREWVDLRFHNPAMVSVTVRIERDDEFCGLLEKYVPEFCERLDEASARLGVEWKRGASGLAQGMEPRRAV